MSWWGTNQRSTMHVTAPKPVRHHLFLIAWLSQSQSFSYKLTLAVDEVRGRVVSFRREYAMGLMLYVTPRAPGHSTGSYTVLY